jgi:hypothetical protein
VVFKNGSRARLCASGDKWTPDLTAQSQVVPVAVLGTQNRRPPRSRPQSQKQNKVQSQIAKGDDIKVAAPSAASSPIRAISLAGCSASRL